MLFKDEPEWMKKARQAPLHSTYDSRQPVSHLKEHEGHAQKAKHGAMS